VFVNTVGVRKLHFELLLCVERIAFSLFDTDRNYCFNVLFYCYCFHCTFYQLFINCYCFQVLLLPFNQLLMFIRFGMPPRANVSKRWWATLAEYGLRKWKVSSQFKLQFRFYEIRLKRSNPCS
jgi:hypothetical protein